VIIAGVGAFAAALLVYLAHFRPPHIASILGPKIMVFYRDFNPEKQTELVGVIAPVTFVNTAMKTGAVISASLLVYRKDTPNERFYFEWDKFGKLARLESKKDGVTEQTEQWVHEEEAHALAVLGNSSITKMVYFYWFSKDKHLVLREGKYDVTLCFWDQAAQDRLPKLENHKMLIDSTQAKVLEDCRKAVQSVKVSATVYLRLDQKLQPNQFMTENESKKLLGLTR
jgi:hypothetical protein